MLPSMENVVIFSSLTRGFGGERRSAETVQDGEAAGSAGEERLADVSFVDSLDRRTSRFSLRLYRPLGWSLVSSGRRGRDHVECFNDFDEEYFECSDGVQMNELEQLLMADL